MRRPQFFLFLLFFLTAVSSIPALDSNRMLCTTITQGQQTRFNRCRNGEVMTGIQNLDPITVICTTLMANCRMQTSSTESPQKTEENSR